MPRNVDGKKVAILTENGFEEVELTSPMNALEQAGAIVHIVSPQKEKVKAWDHDHWSIELPVDKNLRTQSQKSMICWYCLAGL